MNENEFIEICIDLHDNLLKLKEEKNQEEINNALFTIRFDAEHIIETQNIIESDNDKIKELFSDIFNVSCGIKQHIQQMEHYRASIKNLIEKSSNDEKLAEECSMFSMSQKILTSKYDKILELTEKVLNLGKTK